MKPSLVWWSPSVPPCFAPLFHKPPLLLFFPIPLSSRGFGIGLEKIPARAALTTTLITPNVREGPSQNLRGGDENAYLMGLRTTRRETIWSTRSHVSMIHNFGSKESATETFTFTFLAGSSLKLSFDWPLSLPAPLDRPFKRRRALSDVDGEGKEARKKRRLRLHLITSRLSRPFSEPASNIGTNRGLSKISVWAKNKALGKNVLRKAAIMNRVRRRMDAAKDFMRVEQERTRELSLREVVLQKPRCLDFPLPPSPLGLSNYDALDLEDDVYDHEDDEDIDKVSAVYSDFNIMNPTTSIEGDDYAYLDALDGISPEDLPDTPPPPPEESIAEMLREDSRGESIFVQVRE